MRTETGKVLWKQMANVPHNSYAQYNVTAENSVYLTAGSLTGNPINGIAWLVGLSILYLLIAFGLYKRVEYRARQAGNLEMW